eukprot:1743746-Prymnesium_polylepis.2
MINVINDRVQALEYSISGWGDAPRQPPRHATRRVCAYATIKALWPPRRCGARVAVDGGLAVRGRLLLCACTVYYRM